ncbi:HYC_CC_PP family protein [Mucilaginibacter lacusdianchii]|uniref:HYC_CC_PP family protein n=1 Tax=Mucilaginibacter lacusdianchii TaxID=2684211 RepID=UPI00131EA1EF|nr:hypothetical protein [Mucilaginibacter sp. JXJ CY 39]
MLKRTGAILLTLLYTLTVMGFAMDMHYCGKKLASVKINAEAKHCKTEKATTACGMKMKCCKDKHMQVKVKDAHQSVSAFVPAKLLALHLPVTFLPYFEPVLQTALVKRADVRGPPDVALAKVPVFLKNCSFRI